MDIIFCLQTKSHALCRGAKVRTYNLIWIKQQSQGTKTANSCWEKILKMCRKQKLCQNIKTVNVFDVCNHFQNGETITFIRTAMQIQGRPINVFSRGDVLLVLVNHFSCPFTTIIFKRNALTHGTKSRISLKRASSHAVTILGLVVLLYRHNIILVLS